MLLLLSSIVLGLITDSSGAFTCSNKVLTSADSPYSFCVPGTTNSYNGVYNCTWTINVPYMNYALLTTNSLLSASDSVTIVYPGGSYSNQLHNAHPQNTFWLPEGESTVQFIAKSNGTLSFNLQWNKISLSSSLNVFVYPDSLPRSIPTQDFASSYFTYQLSGNSKSIALGVAGRNINASISNPHPLRACFIFESSGTNRTFITTFDDIYPNVKLFDYNVTVLCVTNTTFDGMIVGQPGEGASLYSTYTVAIADKRNNSLSLQSSGKNVSAVTVITRDVNTHIVLTRLTLSNQTFTFSIRNGGVASNVVATVSSSNATLPFNIRSTSATFSVSGGNAQFSLKLQNNIPAGANCPNQAGIQASDSPYSFYNGSQPIPYNGPFTCSWIVYIKPYEYAIMNVSGQLSPMDLFYAIFPGSKQAFHRDINLQTQKVFLPPGYTTVYFAPTSEGTFQMNITWLKVVNQTTYGGDISDSSYPAVFPIDVLRRNPETFKNGNGHNLGFAAALSNNATIPSVESIYERCFVMDTVSQQFYTTLDNILGKVTYFNSSIDIKCMDSLPSIYGFTVAAQSEFFNNAYYTVIVPDKQPQEINVTTAQSYMTVLANLHQHVNITGGKFSSPSTVLTIFAGETHESMQFTGSNISYPIVVNFYSQLIFFTVDEGFVNLTIKVYQLAPKNAFCTISILTLLFSIL